MQKRINQILCLFFNITLIFFSVRAVCAHADIIIDNGQSGTRIKNVLRTIGTGLSTETRDYHINILKQKF